jgi:Tfp pilus assembly protein FimT
MVDALTTIVMVGALASTSVLAASRIRPAYYMSGAVRQIEAELQKARLSAVTENNRYVVRFTSDHTVTVLDDDDNDGVADGGEAVRTTDVQSDWPGTTMASSGTLTFLTDGTASAATTITLQRAGAATRTIIVSRAGSVRVP